MEGWQDLDAAALDAAYENGAHIPGAAAYPQRWADAAAAFRARSHATLDIPYGPGPAERFDLFHPDGAARGLIVFVHGGYWRRFGKADWSHLAAGGVAAGYAVAMPGYPLAPAARIHEITGAIARALAAAAARVPGPIRLAGHSAGGHLVARMLMAGAVPEGLARRIVACVPISPVADLRPLVATSMNADLRLTGSEAAEESPALGRPALPARVAIHVGALERPAFHWQAQALARAWDVPVHVAEGRHHFDVIDALQDPDTPLMADLLR